MKTKTQDRKVFNYTLEEFENAFKIGTRTEQERILKIIKKYSVDNRDYEEGWELNLIRKIKRQEK